MSLTLKQNNNILQLKIEISAIFSSDFSGHDFQHTIRVLKNAEYIQKQEGGDLYTIILASLLHDVDDKKISPETYENKDNARRFLKMIDAENEVINDVLEIISSVSFSDGKKPLTIEGKIVQDADRLDAIGAIGVARCFAYGGSKKRPIYYDNDFSSDKKENCDSGVAHFYSKLFKLESIMNTGTAKILSRERTEFMSGFLLQLSKEINDLYDY